MRALIGSTRYDTQKAKLIAEREVADPDEDYPVISERLYRTSAENWFMVLGYDDGSEEILPQHPRAAYEWLCEVKGETFADRYLKARWWHSGRKRMKRIDEA